MRDKAKEKSRKYEIIGNARARLSRSCLGATSVAIERTSSLKVVLSFNITPAGNGREMGMRNISGVNESILGNLVTISLNIRQRTCGYLFSLLSGTYSGSQSASSFLQVQNNVVALSELQISARTKWKVKRRSVWKKKKTTNRIYVEYENWYGIVSCQFLHQQVIPS